MEMEIKNIGNISIRSVDSIKYAIYKNNSTNEIYYLINNCKYTINLSDKYKNLNNINISLSETVLYIDFLKEINDVTFPKCYYINNNKIINDNNNIEIPNLTELYSYKSILDGVKLK